MISIRYKDENIKPTKVVCVGRNYMEHIRELSNEVPSSMVIFFKPNSSITEKLKFISDDTHFECEITFLVINQNISAVGVGFDLTKRDIQNELKKQSLPWERAKSFNCSAVFSEFVDIENTNSINFELFVNGSLRQKGGVSDMIYKPEDILKECKSFTTFEDGDVIMSGTPKGVGAYERDDIFLVKLYNEKELILEKSWKVE